MSRGQERPRKKSNGDLMNTDTITLAAQVGEADTEDVINDPHDSLRRLLRERCKGPYSPDVDEFALILRFDGQITQWNIEGCAYLRRSFKERYITIDIFVPRDHWKEKTKEEIRMHLANGVREALLRCVARLRKDKTPVDAEKLMADYDLVEKEYLKGID